MVLFHVFFSISPFYNEHERAFFLKIIFPFTHHFRPKELYIVQIAKD